MRSTVLFAAVSTVSARRAATYAHVMQEAAEKGEQKWGNPNGWPECLTIPTFPGKCPIEEHPGACFRTDGKMWSCWSDWEEKDDDECMGMTLNDEIVGFEGACKYADYGKKMAEADVEDCWEVDKCLAECHPVNDKWGACYLNDDTGVEKSERCMCAPRPGQGGNVEFIATLLKGGCRTKQVGYLDKAYDAICKFPDDGPQPVYQCESVPTFNARNAAVACNPAIGNDFACFSTTRRTPWQCGMSAEMNPSCRTTTLTPAGPPFFDGACLYKGAPGWEDALVYEEP